MPVAPRPPRRSRCGRGSSAGTARGCGGTCPSPCRRPRTRLPSCHRRCRCARHAARCCALARLDEELHGAEPPVLALGARCEPSRWIARGHRGAVGNRPALAGLDLHRPQPSRIAAAGGHRRPDLLGGGHHRAESRSGERSGSGATAASAVGEIHVGGGCRPQHSLGAVTPSGRSLSAAVSALAVEGTGDAVHQKLGQLQGGPVVHLVAALLPGRGVAGAAAPGTNSAQRSTPWSRSQPSGLILRPPSCQISKCRCGPVE